MIPFSPPRVDQKTIDAVTETLLSGWITTGPKTKLFEKKLAQYIGVDHVMALNSATAGLELMLRWFGVSEGDEVIIPAYTYCATANVVNHCGAKVVFVDVNHDFNINVKLIKEHITPNTKVIMPVDIAGMPVDYDDIMDLVNQPEVKAMFNPSTDNQKQLGRIMVLADTAHSIGALYKGKYTGTQADASSFSFHAVKNLTTAEGGGVALNLPQPFNNEEIYKFLCLFSLHGQSKDALAKTQIGGWKYDIVEAGFKCNMTDIQAAIGLVELERYENDTLVRRREIFDKYSTKLSTFDWAEVPVYETAEKRSCYHVYMLRIKPATEQMRDTIIQKISEKGVAVNVHFQPVPNFTFYKNLGYKASDYPVALKNYTQEISLPVYYNLTNEQIDTVLNAVISSVEDVLAIHA